MRTRKDQVKLATELSLCPQCFYHFLQPQNEDILNETCQKVKEHNLEAASRLTYTVNDSEARGNLSKLEEMYKLTSETRDMCSCCFGAMSYDVVDNLAARVVHAVASRNALSNSPSTPVCIEVLLPPIMDAFRITARTVVTRHPEKLFAFPSVDELLIRLLTARLSGQLNIVPPEEARVKITLQAEVGYQLEFCQAIWEDFKIKKVKRKFMPGQQQAAELRAQVEGGAAAGAAGSAAEPQADEVTRKSIDSLMMYHKSLDAAGYIVLEQRLKAYMASIAADSRETSDSTAEKSPANRRVSWKVSSRACPVYLLGRYRKLARDVPQSPWTVAAHGSGEDADAGDALEVDAPEDANKRPRTEGGSAEGRGDDQGGAAEEKAAGKSVTIQYQRKGRCSVEEVVNAEVRKALGAADCRMHACGREDIDVRCLGNGRPFAMEVQDPAVIYPDQATLDAVRDRINRGEGLNSEKDVEVVLLKVVDRRVWETMQTKAEEKRKGYCCVVWAERALTRADLDRVEALSREGNAVDEDGEACVELRQKTPLRVLHRRSLLDRSRHVYRIETTLLNSHFFLMRLVTSAGTYVKEFVHGDMGRTSPSVSALLDCQADIMQLDVTWLYDDLEGNEGNVESSPDAQERALDASLSLARLNALKLPTYSS